MSETFTIRQGTQVVIDDLRIGVVGAGLADGTLAARLVLRTQEGVQDVVLRVGERAETSRSSIALVSATEDSDVPGTGTAVVEVADLPG